MSVEFEPFYLYGWEKRDMHWFKYEPYVDVLNNKVYSATEKIAELANGTLTDEVMLNIKACQRAIDHNEKLLKEIE